MKAIASGFSRQHVQSALPRLVAAGGFAIAQVSPLPPPAVISLIFPIDKALRVVNIYLNMRSH